MHLPQKLTLSLTRPKTDSEQEKPILAGLYLADTPHKDLINQEKLFLHQNEQAYFYTLNNLSRKNSYLLGRFCAKQALGLLHPNIACNTIYINKGVFDFPVVELPRELSTTISISHSKGVGAAIAFPQAHPMAIDIEQIQPSKMPAIQSKMSPAETTLINSTNLEPDIGYTCIWTMKEALSKALKCGLNINFKLLEIEKFEQKDNIYFCRYKNFNQYKSFCFKIKNFICAIIMPRKTMLEDLTSFSLT
jgi:4'-phosphopantetheinyl transferase